MARKANGARTLRRGSLECHLRGMSTVPFATDGDDRMERIKPRGPKAPRRPRLADRLELQEQVTELAAQQAAMSEVLRSIANSPHELEPIFDTVIANAARLCRAEVSALILIEEHGLRLVARTGAADGYYVKGHLYPVSEGVPSRE